MHQLSDFPHGHLLEFLSAHNQGRVIEYLTFMHIRHRAPSSLSLACRSLKSFCVRLPPHRQALVVADFSATTPDDIDAWLHAVYEQGLAPTTIKMTLCGLRRFFDFFSARDACPQQPVRRFRHDVVVPHTLPRPIPPGDVVAFFRVIDSLYDRLMFLLMLRCGLRLGEVQRLTWEVIRWEHRAIRIDNAKGHVDRVVYYSSDVAHDLRIWQRQCPNPARYVFPSPLKSRAGQPISIRYINDHMHRYCATAQLPTQYSPHCFRHTFATDLLNAGAPLEVVKELMGHRFIAMTLRYTKIYDQTIRQQYDQAMASLEPRQAL